MADTHDLFISYSHDDADYVEQLADHLQRAGVSAWYDEDIGRDNGAPNKPTRQMLVRRR